MEIRTNRFLLRDFCDSDTAMFERCHRGERFLEYYADEVAEPGHANSLVKRFQEWAAEQPRENCQFAVVPKGALTLIGSAGVRLKAAPPGTGEIGMGIAEQYWGGFAYALEILAALASFGFGTLGLESLYGSTVSGNTRVGRLLDAIGARPVERPTPEWMSAKGWQQIEWRLGQQDWRNCSLARRWSEPIVST